MFNLNVDSYTLEDLKKIFLVEPSGVINSMNLHEILEDRYKNLLDSFNNNPQLNSQDKKQYNDFLFKAKNKLQNLLSPQITNTTFQDSKNVSKYSMECFWK